MKYRATYAKWSDEDVEFGEPCEIGFCYLAGGDFHKQPIWDEIIPFDENIKRELERHLDIYGDIWVDGTRYNVQVHEKGVECI